jgi:hypothetical protein
MDSSPKTDKKCRKCGGAGWVWWYELDDYDGPAADTSDCYGDDNRYICDECGWDDDLKHDETDQEKKEEGRDQEKVRQ